jgi:serpin B
MKTLEKTNPIAFVRNIHSQLTNKGNCFYSPFSIQAAMSMVTSGAKDSTEQALAVLLGLPEDKESRDSYFKELIGRINTKNDQHELVASNALWGQKGFDFKKDYINRIQANYSGNLVDVDFSNAGAAAGQINSWCNEATKTKIPTIVNADALNSETRLVLTNAIYFKGKWQVEFEKKNTIDRVFHSPSGDKKVPTMHQTNSFSYSENERCQLLVLPYKGGMTMRVLLPKGDLPNDSLIKVYEDSLKTLRYEEKVQVFLPKFKLETEYQLSKVFKKMGCGIAFSDSADFSDITDRRDEALKISEVIHKAFVECDEEGTEAAAATAVVMIRCSAVFREPKPIIFNADHPFTFFICQNEDVLFAGQVNNL